MLRGIDPLLRAAHIEPSIAVTLAATALAVGVGLGGRSLLVALAVGSGQLSIGWSNDWLDWRRAVDRGRSDKPVARNQISPRAVAVSATVALLVCVVASVALGIASALTHLIGVAAGWLYNLRAKLTWYSVAPWAVAFALLPAVVTLATPLERWPAWWMIAAGGLLGSGAHFANVLPDLERDRAVGVAGLPHRLGRTGALWTTVVLVGTGIALVVVGSAPGPLAWAVGLGGAIALLAIAIAAARGYERLAFRGVAGLLLLLAVGLVAGSTALY